MHAADFDYAADCQACGGTGETERYETCPSCNGRHDHGNDPAGTVNRLASARPGYVRYGEEVNAQGYVIVHEWPEKDEDTGGLEGRFGTWSPADVTAGPMADYQADVRDQLQNQPLGGSANAPYDVNGHTVEEADMPDGTWPESSDLTAAQVREWATARGDDGLAAIMQALIDEPDSPWVE